MKHSLILLTVVMLSCSPVKGADAVPPNYDFTLETAGSVIQRKIAGAEQTPITRQLPLGGPIEIAVDTVYLEAKPESGPYLSLMAFLTVTDKSDPCKTAQVTALTSARLSVEWDSKGGVLLRIVALPTTLSATAAFPNQAWARDFVMCMAQELAAKLSSQIAMDGLNVIAAVRCPGSPPIQVIAYELGYGWVLQVWAGTTVGSLPPPRIFQIGNSFSISLNACLIQRLADQQYAAGIIPHRLDARGLPREDGPITVDSVKVCLEPDVLGMDWLGHLVDGQSTVVSWKMGFIDTADGVVLHLTSLTVDGKNQEIPEAMGPVNPIDALIKNMMFGPNGGAIYASPLGTVKITLGCIMPSGIFIAGRA